MSILASKTPRDLNHDPLPWVNPDRSMFYKRSSHSLDDPSSVLRPRPEFDHVQHNAPNPILVEFRASLLPVDEWHMAVFATEIYGGMRDWDEEGHQFHVLTKASDDELDHAERVLNRLVRFADVVAAIIDRPELRRAVRQSTCPLCQATINVGDLITLDDFDLRGTTWKHAVCPAGKFDLTRPVCPGCWTEKSVDGSCLCEAVR